MREQINKQQLLDRIDSLLRQFSNPAFPDDVETMRNWKSQVYRAMINDNLKEHEGIKMIIDFIIKKIESIDLILLNAYSDKCSDLLRDRLLDKKEMYTDFLELFPQETELKQIEQEVKDNETLLDN